MSNKIINAFSHRLLLFTFIFSVKFTLNSKLSAALPLEALRKAERNQQLYWVLRREPVSREISVFSEGKNGWKEETHTIDGKEKALLFLIHSRPCPIVRLCEKLTVTFVFLPRSANAGHASWSCLGPVLPYTAKKSFKKSWNFRKKKRRKLKYLGQLYITLIFSLLWDPSLGNPCFSVRNASLYRFWKALPKDMIVPKSLLQDSPVLHHLPALLASIFPTAKKGTTPVFKSLFGTERSSMRITDQLGICQVFCFLLSA